MRVDVSSDARVWQAEEPTMDGVLTPAEHLARRIEWDTWANKGMRAGYVDELVAADSTWVPAAVKWDPLQARDPGGQWTAGGGGNAGKPAAPRPSPDVRRPGKATPPASAPRPSAQAEAAAQGAQTLARNRQSEANALAAAQSRIQTAGRAKIPQGASTDAANAARKTYNIPTGKQFRSLPPAKQQAAQHILAATRTLSNLNAQKTAAAARVAAAQKELAAKNLTGKQKAVLQQAVDKAKARQKLVDAQIQAARKELNTASKAWGHHA